MDSLHEPADSGTASSDPAAFDIFALRELPDLLKIHLAAATLHETFCCAVVGAMVRTWCEHVPISARWLSRYVRTPRRGRSRS